MIRNRAVLTDRAKLFHGELVSNLFGNLGLPLEKMGPERGMVGHSVINKDDMIIVPAVVDDVDQFVVCGGECDSPLRIAMQRKPCFCNPRKLSGRAV